ncbi:MAG: hypothetical protein SH848_21185 [Saprospiraceae bacterium]|nr:hypothetical protein [Saprospiraceae bacterium]MDZ4706457.1 hypothetical protein [Saprospiraceae bacterium]
MIAVVDSGSSKADWMLVGKERSWSVHTMGFNPVFHSSETIRKELDTAFEADVPKADVQQLFYYGSGCWDAKRKSVIADALKGVFGNAQLEIEHDLLGAARATCGTNPGIACIIGTGSNSCLYDGRDVIDNVVNLGYLIGDEGSGTHLGKQLIRAYFYRELPHDLIKAFEAAYPGGKDAILEKLYGTETPNVFLATFSRFLSEHRDHFFIQKLLYRRLSEFIDRHVRKYEGHLSVPVHFIGSVAYYFQDILKIILEERAMKPGIFIKNPIDRLVAFHSEHHN